MCLTLLDDTALRRFLPRRLAAAVPGPGTRAPRWRRYLLAPVAAGILLLSGIQMARMVVGGAGLPGPARTVMGWAAPLRFVGSYGLFAVMTTERREIVIEGSEDGRTWVAYEFHWKPGDPSERPAFVAPHMPRLDWQMWFAALGDHRRNPWLQNFMVRLMQGQPEVLALLRANPFPENPPRYLRATLHDYHFTDFGPGREDGAWWRRELKGLYAPVLSRRR